MPRHEKTCHGGSRTFFLVIFYKFATSKIFSLVSVVMQAGLNLTLLETLKNVFS